MTTKLLISLESYCAGRNVMRNTFYTKRSRAEASVKKQIEELSEKVHLSNGKVVTCFSVDGVRYLDHWLHYDSGVPEYNHPVTYDTVFGGTITLEPMSYETYLENSRQERDSNSNPEINNSETVNRTEKDTNDDNSDKQEEKSESDPVITDVLPKDSFTAESAAEKILYLQEGRNALSQQAILQLAQIVAQSYEDMRQQMIVLKNDAEAAELKLAQVQEKLDDKDNQLKNKDEQFMSTINELRTQSANHQKEIEEKDRLLQEKDIEIRSMLEQSNENIKAFNDQAAILAEKDKLLNDQEHLLSAKNEELNKVRAESEKEVDMLKNKVEEYKSASLWKRLFGFKN